jgi:hypothetical protein
MTGIKTIISTTQNLPAPSKPQLKKEVTRCKRVAWQIVDINIFAVPLKKIDDTLPV